MRDQFSWLSFFQCPALFAPLSVLPCKWQMRTAHQSNNCDEFNYDCENDYTNNGLENDMTVYVKTISGKTIIVRCNKTQSRNNSGNS